MLSLVLWPELPSKLPIMLTFISSIILLIKSFLSDPMNSSSRNVQQTACISTLQILNISDLIITTWLMRSSCILLYLSDAVNSKNYQKLPAIATVFYIQVELKYKAYGLILFEKNMLTETKKSTISKMFLANKDKINTFICLRIHLNWQDTVIKQNLVPEYTLLWYLNLAMPKNRKIK